MPAGMLGGPALFKPQPSSPRFLGVLPIGLCPRQIEPSGGIGRRMSGHRRTPPPASPRCPLGRLAIWTTSRASAARTPTAHSTANVTQATSRSAAARASGGSSACSSATPAAPASRSARGHRCTAATCPKRRHSRSSSISTRAAASVPPGGSSASPATPSSGSPVAPANTPTTPTRSSWLFPPRTREVPFDEKWSFVAKKQKNCDPTDPADDPKGDWWDHVAFDPEHRLVLAVVPGARSIENAEEVVAAAKGRTGGATPRLMTSDEYPADAAAIEAAFGVPVPTPPGRPGRRPVMPRRRLPADLTYATVHKQREDDRVVAVDRRLVFGTEDGRDAALGASAVSRTVHTSFLERQHGTDRRRDARQTRTAYRFSKDCRVHVAMSYFPLYRSNFGGVVRTLRQRDGHGRWQRRTPAMAAGLSDHIWSVRQWIAFPAVQVA